MQTPRILTKMASQCDKVILLTAAGLLCIEIGLVIANVFARYALHLPLAWSAELARYCMVWSALLGSAVLVRQDDHLRVALIDAFLTPRGLRILHVFVTTLSLLFYAVLLISGCVLVIRTRGQVAASIPFLPISVVYAVVPFSALLMVRNVIFSLRDIWQSEEASE